MWETELTIWGVCRLDPFGGIGVVECDQGDMAEPKQSPGRGGVSVVRFEGRRNVVTVLSTVQPRVPKFYPTRRRGGYHYRYGIVAADKVYRGACGRSIRLVVMRHGAFCLWCWNGGMRGVEGERRRGVEG